MSISRRGFVATAVVGMASGGEARVSSGQLPNRRPAVDTAYWLKATGTPGLAVALLEGRKTRDVLSFGSTDPRGARQVGETTMFQAASLSKQALLYAALETVEAGKLDLDRPLVQYLATPIDLPGVDLGRIAARHVLTHTTGWPNWPPENEPMKAVRPLGQWGYSGAGFRFLQDALEGIWGESTVDYTRRLVLDPLGMERSSFVWRPEYVDTAVQGFDQDGHPTKPWRAERPNGASSLVTSAREYAMLLERFLSPELRRRHPAVYQRQVGIDARLGWSLGWGTADDVLWQWGHSDGFKTFAALAPARGMGIVCLSNGHGGQRVNREWVNGWLGVNLPAFFFRNVDL